MEGIRSVNKAPLSGADRDAPDHRRGADSGYRLSRLLSASLSRTLSLLSLPRGARSEE